MTSRVVWAAANEQIKAETVRSRDRFFGIVHAATTTSIYPLTRSYDPSEEIFQADKRQGCENRQQQRTKGVRAEHAQPPDRGRDLFRIAIKEFTAVS
jgi:hypothetical protein